MSGTPYFRGMNARCQECLMVQDLCICALIPKISLPTRVVLLMHIQEKAKPSNTGKLALQSLTNSEVRYRGMREGPPMSLDGLMDDEYETWLLRMGPEAVPVETLVKDKKKPVRLLVPDGTWSQASSLGAKLVRKLPVKTVCLQAGPPSMYRLRSEHHPDGLATFEAISRVLGVLEGAEVQAKLEHIFRIMVDRVLWTRGQIPAHEVFGGLPEKK